MDDRTERRIVERAEYVGEAVTLLAQKRESLSFDAYRANREQRDIVEREFETAIEACIDVGEMLLEADDLEAPETNAGVFREPGKRCLIGSGTGERMAQAAGFRNVLAHRYGNEIDNEDVYNVPQDELGSFKRYLQEIGASLNPSE